MIFKPLVATPYLRWTQLMEHYRCQPWITSIPTSILKVHIKIRSQAVLQSVLPVDTAVPCSTLKTHVQERYRYSAQRFYDCIVRDPYSYFAIWNRIAVSDNRHWLIIKRVNYEMSSDTHKAVCNVFDTVHKVSEYVLKFRFSWCVPFRKCVLSLKGLRTCGGLRRIEQSEDREASSTIKPCT